MSLNINNADGMRRKPNFSLDEKLFLINYIKEHKSLHSQLDPYIGGDLTKSLNGWNEIASAFEQHFPGKTSRDPNDLRSCWKRIRDKARCIYAPNSTLLGTNKQLTKPKWLAKKKPVPNIVSKLAWEFMVQQECSQNPQLMDIGQNEWSENSYDQPIEKSAESPELLVLEPDDCSEITDSNDVIRIKKEWIDDVGSIETPNNQEYTKNIIGQLEVESKSSTISPLDSRKQMTPKIMMVESLQSETRRNSTTHMTDNIYRTDISQFSTDDPTSFQHDTEATRPYLENNPYSAKKSQKEKTPRSRSFTEDKPISRRGSSGQESIESIGYLSRKTQDNTLTSGNHKPRGFSPSQGQPSSHQSTFMSLQESLPVEEKIQESRDLSYKKRGRVKVSGNLFDRRQSRYFQGMRYRRSRNFLARRERALENSRRGQQSIASPPHQDITGRNQAYNRTKRSAWQINSVNEANLDMEDNNIVFRRTRPERYQQSHTRSGIIEPSENETSSNSEDAELCMLKMAEEEHNIKMQIHKRKLRVMMLKQWCLEQECLQAGYDLPPDYF